METVFILLRGRDTLSKCIQLYFRVKVLTLEFTIIICEIIVWNFYGLIQILRIEFSEMLNSKSLGDLVFCL